MPIRLSPNRLPLELEPAPGAALLATKFPLPEPVAPLEPVEEELPLLPRLALSPSPLNGLSVVL